MRFGGTWPRVFCRMPPIHVNFRWMTTPAGTGTPNSLSSFCPSGGSERGQHPGFDYGGATSMASPVGRSFGGHGDSDFLDRVDQWAPHQSYRKCRLGSSRRMPAEGSVSTTDIRAALEVPRIVLRTSSRRRVVRQHQSARTEGPAAGNRCGVTGVARSPQAEGRSTTPEAARRGAN